MLIYRFLALALLLAGLAGCSRPVAKPALQKEELPGKGGFGLSFASKVEVEEEKYVEGAKKSERTVRRDADGKAVPHGKATTWHPNGKEASAGEYFNGVKSGVWIERSETGQLISQGAYRDGKKDGRWISFPEAKVRLEEEYRDDALRSQHLHREDSAGAYTIRVGTWREWHDTPEKLKSVQHFKDGKEEGEWIVANEKGQKLEVRTYRAGLPEGSWQEWHADGSPKSLREFREGKPHGKATIWFENGQMEEQGEFADGEKHGLWTNWLANSQKTKETHYDHGKLNGKIIEWYLGQQVWYEGQYDQGLKAGDWITWYKAEGQKPPQKRSIERYRQGEPDGIWEYWYKNGQLERREEYAAGKPVGKWKTYYENGQQLAETDFADGLPDGLHTRWSQDGKKVAEETYDKGVLVKVLKLSGGSN